MQLIDLKAQQNRIRPEIERRIQIVLDHGKYIMGPEVGELEERLAGFVGVRHCISSASGTDALLMGLMAIGPGDAVLTTPFTFIATAEVIALLGATPVFVDIDPLTFNMDPAQLEKAIQALQQRDSSLYPLPSPIAHRRSPAGSHSPSSLIPKAVLPVDLFGLAADYERINTIANEHGLFVIEDAAQSLGGEYRGKRAGALADVGCTSFFPAKPLGGYGDGGAVFTNDDQLAESLRSIRVHGKGSHKYDNARIGINGRLDTIQAAILLAKLDIFPEEIELRQQVAQRYSDLLRPLSSAVSLPFMPEGHRSAWAQYSLLAHDGEHRQACQTRLKERDIPSVIYYPKPLHQQSAFARLEYSAFDFPGTMDCASRIFSLPMHPYLKANDQEAVARCLFDRERL